jgi:hypothetical protein
MRIKSQTTTASSAVKVTFTPTGENAKDVRVALAPLDVKEALADQPRPTSRRSRKRA